MPLVSVIIPIYNVAPYIELCLRSVMNQSYRNIEVLLIDDCGQDNSIQIARQMLGIESVEEPTSIKEEAFVNGVRYMILHHKQNRGLSAARNTGIDAASGEWLFFLDSDDWVAKGCIETLVSCASQSTDVDITIANYEASNGLRSGGPLLLEDGVYTESLLDLYLSNKYYVPVWNKLVRSAFLKDHGLYFEEGLIHEDYLWSFCVACLVKKIAVINKITYHYLIRETSLDHLPDKRIHVRNYARSIVLQIKFVLNNKSLRHNSKLLFWLEKNKYDRYQNARWAGMDDVAEEIYYMIRQSDYWSLFELFYMRATRGMKLRSLHKFLPKYRGYIYYTQIINKFGF